MSIFEEKAWMDTILEDGDTDAGLGTDDTKGPDSAFYLNVMQDQVKAVPYVDPGGPGSGAWQARNNQFGKDLTRSKYTINSLVLNTAVNDHWDTLKFEQPVKDAIKAIFPRFQEEVKDHEAPPDALAALWPVFRGVVASHRHFDLNKECVVKVYDANLQNAIFASVAAPAVKAAIDASYNDSRACVLARANNYWLINHATGSSMKTVAGSLGKKCSAMGLEITAINVVRNIYAMTHVACPATTLAALGVPIFRNVSARNECVTAISPADELKARFLGFPASTRRLGLASVATNYLASKGLLSALGLNTSVASIMVYLIELSNDYTLGHKGAFWLTGGNRRADIINSGEAINELICAAAGFMKATTPNHTFLLAPSVISLLKTPSESFAKAQAAGKLFAVKANESLIAKLSEVAGLGASNAAVKAYNDATEANDPVAQALAATAIIDADKATSEAMDAALAGLKV